MQYVVPVLLLQPEADAEEGDDDEEDGEEVEYDEVGGLEVLVVSREGVLVPRVVPVYQQCYKLSSSVSASCYPAFSGDVGLPNTRCCTC